MGQGRPVVALSGLTIVPLASLAGGSFSAVIGMALPCSPKMPWTCV